MPQDPFEQALQGGVDPFDLALSGDTPRQENFGFGQQNQAPVAVPPDMPRQANFGYGQQDQGLDPFAQALAPTTGDSGRWKTIAQLGGELGFRVGAAYDPTGKKHNKNSQHYMGDAVDFSVRGKKPEEVNALIEAMKAKGFYVRDERTKPKGQEVWKGAHIHVAVPRTQGVPTVQVGTPAQLAPSPANIIAATGEALKKKQEVASKKVVSTLQKLDSTLGELPDYQNGARDWIKQKLIDAASNNVELNFQNVAPIVNEGLGRGLQKSPVITSGIGIQPTPFEQQQIDAQLAQDATRSRGTMDLLQQAFNLGDGGTTMAGHVAHGDEKMAAITELVRRYVPPGMVSPALGSLAPNMVRPGTTALASGAIGQTLQIPEEIGILTSEDASVKDRAGAIANALMGTVVFDPTDLALKPLGNVFKKIGSWMAKGANPAEAVNMAMAGVKVPPVIRTQIEEAAQLIQKALPGRDVQALPGGEAKALPGKSKTPIAMAPGTKPAERTGRPMWEQPEPTVQSTAKEPKHTVDVYHGSGYTKADFNGGEFFTDSSREASNYADYSALRKAAEENPALDEALSQMMAESDAQSLTDLSPKQVKWLLEDFKVKPESTGANVSKVRIKYDNPADLTDLGGSIKNVGQFWDKLHQRGLLDEPWDALDEYAQDELKDQYRGKAAYYFFENEGVYDRAFQNGHDAVIFTDQGLSGNTEHTSYRVRDASQIERPGTKAPTPEPTVQSTAKEPWSPQVGKKALYQGREVTISDNETVGVGKVKIWDSGRTKTVKAEALSEPAPVPEYKPNDPSDIQDPVLREWAIYKQEFPADVRDKLEPIIRNEAELVASAQYGRPLDSYFDAEGNYVRGIDMGTPAYSDVFRQARIRVVNRLKNGEMPEVLADYPDLAKKYGVASEVAGAPAVSTPETVSNTGNMADAGNPTPEPPPSPSATPSAVPTEYGATNKIVTRERYEAAKKRAITYDTGSGKVDLKAMAEMGAYHVEAGARSFAVWAQKMVEDLGDAVRPHLEKLWGDAHDVLGIEPNEATIAHADVDAMRAKFGLPPRMRSSKPDAELFAEAKELKGDAETIAFRILNDKNPFRPATLSDSEGLALGMRLEELKADLEAAKNAGDTAKWDMAYEKASNIADALDASGSAQGAAFRARQFLLDNSYDEFSMLRRAAKKKGEALLPSEEDAIKNAAAEDAKQKAAVAEARAAEEAAKAEAIAEAAKNPEQAAEEVVASRKGKSQTIEQIRARRAAAAKTIREELAKTLASPVSSILGAGGGGGIAPDVLKFRLALREYAYTIIDEGITKFEDVIARITKDFPEMDRDKVIKELGSPLGDPMTKSEAAIAKAKLIREAQQVKKYVETNAFSRTKVGKEVDKLTKRIKELEAIKAKGQQVIKTKKGNESVPTIIKDLRAKQKALEKELTINVGASSKTKEAIRLEQIDKEIAKIDAKIKAGDFRKETPKERNWSSKRREAEKKLKDMRAMYDAIIESHEPKSWVDMFENVTSNWQLLNPMARVKDLGGNTARATTESTTTNWLRMQFMKLLDPLTEGGVTPQNLAPFRMTMKDAFDTPFWDEMGNKFDQTWRGTNAEAMSKFGNVGLKSLDHEWTAKSVASFVATDLGHVAAGVSDIPFAEMYRRTYLYGWAEGQAKLAGMEGDREVIKDLIRHAPDDVFDDAEKWALYKTYNQANFASRMKKALKGAIAQGRRGAVSAKVFYDLGELMLQAPMRFGKVIQNVQTAGARNSLIGLAEGIGRREAAKRGGRKLSRLESQFIADALATGTLGTVGMAAGLYAFTQGVKFETLFGREMESFRRNPDGSLGPSGKYWWDQGNIQAMETGLPQAMQMGYQLGWEMSPHGSEKGKDPINGFLNMMTASALNQPIAGGMDRFHDDVTDNGVLDALAALMMSRITPGIVSETSTQIDSIKEAIKTGKPWYYGLAFNRPVKVDKTHGFWNRMLDELMKKTPFRGNLPTGSIPTGK